MPDKLTSKYESELEKAIAQAQRRIRALYEEAILTIAFKAATVPLKEAPFALSLYPLLDAEIEKLVAQMHRGIYREIVSSIASAWNLSNQKNDLFVDKRLRGKTPSKRVRQVFYDPNKKAFEAFLARKEKGLDLSKRVWNTLEPFKREMEQSLGLMLSEGQPAAKMATNIKKFLNEPDKLFRRVRGEDGKLRLSKKAREYKPGQGVYRSSYKNALRLTRNENNLAYRNADYERWQKLPFVVGMKTRLSNRHLTYDICDPMSDKTFPKDFHFTGWHVNCLCTALPVMLSGDAYDKYEDAILAGDPVPKIEQVTEVPKEFERWVSKNEERVNGWKSKPYWWSNNNKYVKAALNKN